MLKVCIFNAYCIRNKQEAILEFFQEKNIDIMLINDIGVDEDLQLIFNDTMVAFKICNPGDQRIRGGRRFAGGFMALVSRRYRQSIKVLRTDDERRFVKFSVQGVEFTFVYLPPSLPNSVIHLAMDVAEEGNTGKSILLGDFNARMGEVTGDNKWCQRGRLFETAIANSGFNLVQPTRGRFTSFGQNAGAGVVDLVLTNGPIANNLVVHETESLGGSDHRPVTFHVDIPAPPYREFSRWNIRAFDRQEVRDRYTSLLFERFPALVDSLDELDVDRMWCQIKAWLEGCIEQSCGRFEFKATRKTNFLTSDILEKQREIREESLNYQAIVNNVALSLPVRAAARQRLTVLEKQLAALMFHRREQLFGEMASDMGKKQNRNTLMKLIKCCRKRKIGNGSKLDADNIESYAEHFKKTFGEDPEGTRVARPIPLPRLNPATPDQLGRVETLIKMLQNGKASGCDGIMSEFIKYGGDTVVKMMQTLFARCYEIGKTPTEWKEALVCPVWKKKGDPNDISNYRPISLTCITRRLYERWITAIDLDQHVHKLSDWQGGFRKDRNTLQQVYFLDEVLKKHPTAHHVLLDLKAAYDTVNRSYLWERLYHHYRMSPALIYRLQDLFDFNHTRIILDCKKSEPFSNKRGLQQGSSLSPILFNFYIDELLIRLSQPENPRLNTFGIKSNVLAYADDLQLHAGSLAHLSQLLKICEDWSLEVGMQFAPTKCIYIGNPLRPQSALSLYGTLLPTHASADYLGIPINSCGLDLEKNFTTRTTKARQVTQMLCSSGMNMTGFPQAASAGLYKTFIRPVMEYGIQLTVLNGKSLKMVQQAQDFALRKILGTHRTSSTNMLHKLLQIPKIDTRNLDLNFRFCTALHNSTNASIPAVKMWWKALACRQPLSLTTMVVKKNPWWRKGNLVNHLLTRLGDPNGGQDAMTKEQQVLMYEASIMELDKDNNNVAGALMFESKDPLRHALQPKAFPLTIQGKMQRLAVLRWLTGCVCIHKPCVKCSDGTELSRKHGLACSGAQQLILQQYPFEELDTSPESRLNVLDQLLNKHRRVQEPVFMSQLYQTVHQCVHLIYEKCLGYLVGPLGDWEPP